MLFCFCSRGSAHSEAVSQSVFWLRCGEEGAVPWPLEVTNQHGRNVRGLMWPCSACVQRRSQLHNPDCLFPGSPRLQKLVCHGVFSHAGQLEETVAGRESPKKLLIIWLMCLRLGKWEINHQWRDELLKWILGVLSSVSPERLRSPSPSGNQVQTCCLFTFLESGTAGGRAAPSVLLYEQFARPSATSSEGAGSQRHSQHGRSHLSFGSPVRLWLTFPPQTHAPCL